MCDNVPLNCKLFANIVQHLVCVYLLSAVLLVCADVTEAVVVMGEHGFRDSGVWGIIAVVSVALKPWASKGKRRNFPCHEGGGVSCGATVSSECWGPAGWEELEPQYKRKVEGDRQSVVNVT